MASRIAMNVDWDFTAQTYLDQLPPQEQTKVLHAVERLGAGWPQVEEPRHIQLIASSSEEKGNLYSLRVGNDLRVLFRRQGEAITIVDVVRRSQIDGLRQLRRHG
jgi:mRNA-degrading endonuclease RelE of RelBE toxin-antitoxin system